MVVYVEDNANNQRLLARMLSKRNIEVQFFETPEAAYEAIKKSQPRLIFVDVHLKTRHSGLDLVKWLRAGGITTPIIAVTVFNMLADRKRALEIGCNDYLPKPYSMQQLFDIVDRYLVNDAAV